MANAQSVFDRKSYYFCIGDRDPSLLSPADIKLAADIGVRSALDIITMKRSVHRVEQSLNRSLTVPERKYVYSYLQKKDLVSPERCDDPLRCNSFEDAANQLMDVLHINSRTARFVRNNMNALEPSLPGWLKWFYHDNDSKKIPTDADFSEGWDGFDTSHLVDLSSKGKHVGYMAERFRVVTPSECRGRIHGFVRKHLIERRTVKLNDGEERIDVLTSSDGKNWFYITSDRPIISAEEYEIRAGRPAWQESFRGRSSMMLGWWISSDYDWKVNLSLDGVAIAVTTTPLGCREIFRLRDIPPGKKRRAALLHFVCSHMRRHPGSNGDDIDAEIVIREYLRGKRDFHWNGLNCSIRPAPFDIRRLSSTRIGAPNANSSSQKP